MTLVPVNARLGIAQYFPILDEFIQLYTLHNHHLHTLLIYIHATLLNPRQDGDRQTA